MQILDNVLIVVDNSLLRRNRAVSLDTQLKRCKQRMQDLIGREDNVFILKQAL